MELLVLTRGRPNVCTAAKHDNHLLLIDVLQTERERRAAERRIPGICIEADVHSYVGRASGWHYNRIDGN